LRLLAWNLLFAKPAILLCCAPNRASETCIQVQAELLLSIMRLHRSTLRFFPRFTALALAFALTTPQADAYSVLTHEQIVDVVWLDNLRPMILHRFPGLTEDQLRNAHAFAYGGAVIQDLGYFPLGSKEFSDLVHYVRSGDFVVEMLRQSLDANEYAFALGALAHYCADIEGHPSVNIATGIEYPDLRQKFGPSVTYADKPSAHLQTEFGFDVAQVAKHRYTGQQYHDFIGFKVAESLLERSFSAVYGLPLRDVLTHEDLSIGTYRWAVSRAIPNMTTAALASHRDQMAKEQPDFNRQKFLYHLSRAQYERDFGNKYQKPGFGTRVIAAVLKIMPRVGPFKGAAFRHPTPQTEDLYFKSVNQTIDRYKQLLSQVRANSLQLKNFDLDTGKLTTPGEYSLADQAYTKLLGQLNQGQWALSPELKANLAVFSRNSQTERASASSSTQR
jgi:hypothetical protein